MFPISVKNLCALAALATASVLIAQFASQLFAAQQTDPSWESVQNAIDKRLPSTAIEQLEPIIARSLQDKKYAEAIKAISMKVSLEASIEGNRASEHIQRMEQEIAKAPVEMKPAMQAILANWYWNELRENRWRYMERTQIAGDDGGAEGEDITTWTLPRILQEVESQFELALSDATTLQQIPVATYEELLTQGNASRSYRPTLFDVLAQNALNFYMSGEQVASRRQDAFEISVDSPVFSPIDEFLAWAPSTEDTSSLKLKSIRTLQQLLRFHRQDDDPSARLDVDLQRLEFANGAAVGDGKAARYKAALRRFADEHANHPISARALHDLALVVHQEGDRVEARKIALEGVERQEDSVGGRRCFNLIQQIEAREMAIVTERVWNGGYPKIDVTYRNLSKVYFRLVRYDLDQMIVGNRWSPVHLDQDRRLALLSREPVARWSTTVPQTEDYHERLEQLDGPEQVEFGSYVLIASANEQFDDNDNQVVFTEVWRSDLAIVLRGHQNSALIDGFVLDAESGQPLADVPVSVWTQLNDRMVPRPGLVTDANGLFRIDGATNHQSYMILARRGQDSLSSTNLHSAYRNRPQVRTNEQTIFFTDRAIYRPGQAIQYKGICIAVNQDKDDYETIADREVDVVFYDVSGKEIERRKHRTGRFGSFSGSVTAPRDRLMGRMSLRVDGGPRGATQVTVEEYKRPKFRVAVESPEQAARLNESVEVKGTASAYTGAPINGADVTWRVVRQVRFPVWWGLRNWWLPPQPADSQEIAHGTTRTGSDGSFEIEFLAKPDLSVPAESEMSFRFTVYADVTDGTGETRSDQRTIHLGDTAMTASLSVGRWLANTDPIELSVRTMSLDGVGESAKGRVLLYDVIQPEKVARKPLNRRTIRPRADQRPDPDPANPNSWALGDLVRELAFETNRGGSATVAVDLEAGFYRAKLESVDRFGKPVTADLLLRVLDPDADKLNLKIPYLLTAEAISFEPGETFTAIWGSGYDSARAFIEVEHRGRVIKSYWTSPEVTQATIEQDVTEAMRGGFTLRTTMVRENRGYLESQYVDVPWSNKQLSVKWERFVSKLEPAQKETFTAIITSPDKKQLPAEMVAALYDASLDAFSMHRWRNGFNVFRRDYSRVRATFENQPLPLRQVYYSWNVPHRDSNLTYPVLPESIIQPNRRLQMLRRGRGMPEAAMMFEASPMRSAMADDADGLVAGAFSADSRLPSKNQKQGVGGGDDEPPTSEIDFSQVSARKNLQETAFFFPHLVAAKDGTVKMEFTMPEALTEWKFLGFAHDGELRSGLMTDTIVTAKDLMVQPNPPRFLREGDTIEFTVKVTNQSPTRQTGRVRLTFSNARTGASVDQQLQNVEAERSFDVPSGESTSLSWRLNVADDLGFLVYKAVGSTGRLSDGEEGYLPVLSRRVLITESLPLPIRGAGSRDFEFAKLLASAESQSLVHQSITLQMTSNPSWYAVMALPYLMEFPHECSEQTFNRLYANALARHIAGSHPKIRDVFAQWRGTEALDSPLEKNDDLKSVLLEETPWYRQAKSESQARRGVGILFEDNRLDDETRRALAKLTQAQLADGAWPWFPGGRANDFITLYITTGFGRMRHLGVDLDVSPAIKSLQRLDAWASDLYERVKPEDRKKNHLSTTIAYYLYGRSFFLQDLSVSDENATAFEYWKQQARDHWNDLSHRQSQAHLAVALKRFGDLPAAKEIMDSLKERSVTNEEFGMFWRDLELSWWWYRAPIETQAMMIEAFDEVSNDQQAVEDCKVWLLKQKQTQDWKTTKATADAIYALLLRGDDLLASDSLVEVTLGGTLIEPQDVEAGTGFYEHRFVKDEIQPGLGEVQVTKVDDGVAWGSLHWQYLEDLDQVTVHTSTPIRLAKELFVKTNTESGPVLRPVKGQAVGVGDELVVRLVLKTDRDMEYVHMKDHRGSGTEPVSVLSRYKYQDGLAYYESTRDTASHFFIDYLPKGTYVFEYSTRVQLRGDYQTGVANIQCMYAPEFNSHSESIRIVVE